MLKGFTERALMVFIFAQEEARRSGFKTIGCGHLLLGLIRQGSGSAARVLKSNGVNLAVCRANVEAVTGKGTDFTELDRPWYQKLFNIKPVDRIESDFSEEAKNAVLRSSELAKVSSDGVSTRDLLLGILQTPNNSALAALIRFDKNPAKIEEELLLTSADSDIESGRLSIGARTATGATIDEAVDAYVSSASTIDPEEVAKSKQKLKQLGKVVTIYTPIYLATVSLVIYFVFPYLPGIIIGGTITDAILLAFMISLCGWILPLFTSIVVSLVAALGFLMHWRSNLELGYILQREQSDILLRQLSQHWLKIAVRFFAALLAFIMVSLLAPSILRSSSWYGLVIAAVIVVILDLVVGLSINNLFGDKSISHNA
jgi:hypothetical protein